MRIRCVFAAVVFAVLLGGPASAAEDNVATGGDVTPARSTVPAMLLTVVIPSMVAGGVFYAIRRPRQF